MRANWDGIENTDFGKAMANILDDRERRAQEEQSKFYRGLSIAIPLSMAFWLLISMVFSCVKK
jgi:hypothetical protein